MSDYYTSREVFLRIVWQIVRPTLFRCSPRLLYGWRNLILKMMGAKIGKGVKIFPSAIITFPWLLETGDKTVIAWGVKIYNLGKITIGSRTVVSQYAHLCGGTHDYKDPNFKLLRTGLEIGNRVWIATEAFIGPSVHIGDNAVVGARSVVVSDVEADTIVAGNPARRIGNR